MVHNMIDSHSSTLERCLYLHAVVRTTSFVSSFVVHAELEPWRYVPWRGASLSDAAWCIHGVWQLSQSRARVQPRCAIPCCGVHAAPAAGFARPRR